MIRSSKEQKSGSQGAESQDERKAIVSNVVSEVGNDTRSAVTPATFPIMHPFHHQPNVGSQPGLIKYRSINRPIDSPRRVQQANTGGLYFHHQIRRLD